MKALKLLWAVRSNHDSVLLVECSHKPTDEQLDEINRFLTRFFSLDLSEYRMSRDAEAQQRQSPDDLRP